MTRRRWASAATAALVVLIGVLGLGPGTGAVRPTEAAPLASPIEPLGEDGSTPTTDPDVHHPDEAAKSDRSILSWLLVGAALLVVVVMVAGVFLVVRERDR